MKVQQEDLVRAHLWLLDRVHRSVLGTVSPGVGSEDLRASGCLGLVQAAVRFDQDAGVPFPVFAEVTVRDAMLDCVGTADDATPTVDAVDLPARMRAVMRKLPPAHRASVELTYLQGLSGSLIAAMLRVTPTQVSQLRNEALERIRRELLPPPPRPAPEADRSDDAHVGSPSPLGDWHVPLLPRR